MSQCKKFAPNIFNKTKCSNCFRQKEEHSAVALECNRASRTIARSGYLFLAPDWDFSVPLNRTKRWQRRWFVLYDDGELSYSVDEHPDTIPQGSVDMAQVLEVTSAEQLTGHPHSLALTAPDRVTFVKAASREDARWWLELLAVFPRRHKRNATFPGGRASPSLPHLGRSASPQPPRPPRHGSEGGGGGGGGGGGPRVNFTTPPLKEERDPSQASSLISCTISTSGSSSSVGSNPSPRCSLVGVLLKEDAQQQQQQQLQQLGAPAGQGRPTWLPEPSQLVCIDPARDALLANPRTEYLISSGSPPTRDKLRCEDKARARRDWRHERLRDIATALTDRSPESSLALPAEGLLHLKKGWLWHRESTCDGSDQWRRRWWVLCGPSLLGYRDQDEEAGSAPLVSVELSSVTGYSELRTDTRFGFQVQWSGGAPLTLSAVTMGIRSNWLQALRKAAPGIIEGVETVDGPEALPSSSGASSASSSRHSTASSGQLTGAAEAATAATGATSGGSPPPINTANLRAEGIRLRSERGSIQLSSSCRLSTGSSSGAGTPTTPRSVTTLFSSDDEYRTASEGGRRDSMTDDWTAEYGAGAATTSLVKSLLNRSKEQRLRTRPHKLPRCQSRQSTLDSNISSPDELDSSSTNNNTASPVNSDAMTPSSSECAHRPYHRHSVADMRTRKLHLQLQLDEQQQQMQRQREESEAAEKVQQELECARSEVAVLEAEARRLRGLLGEAASKELKSRDAVYELEKIERDLTLKLEKLLREHKSLNRRLAESDEATRESDERGATLNRELQAKQRIVVSLQEELTCANERCATSRLENDRLYKKLQELDSNTTNNQSTHKPAPKLHTISHLTNIDLDSNLASLTPAQLTQHCLEVRVRFERAVAEIRTLQCCLREAHAHADRLQVERLRFGQRVEGLRVECEGRVGMLVERVGDLTGKLVAAERAGRGLRGKLQGVVREKRRSLSLKGRESFSVTKELEDKVTLLEAKLLALEDSSSAATCTQHADRGRSSTRRSKNSTATSASATAAGRRSTDNGSPIDDRSLRRLRRKSLDGATTSEPMKLLMRLNALEEKVAGREVGGGGGGKGTSSESLSNAGEVVAGTESGGFGESADVTLALVRDKYLHCITSLRDTTLPAHPSLAALDGHMRELGRILLRTDCTDTDTADAAMSVVAQLERALQRQYKQLYERRLRLKDRGELTDRARVELLAEKIAFEDVIIGRINEAIRSTATSTDYLNTRETVETVHLLRHLHSKLTSPASPPPSGTYLHSSISHLTHLYTQHLLNSNQINSSMFYDNSTISSLTIGDDESVVQLVLDERAQLHEALAEYQRVKVTELADRLAEETISLVQDDSCSLLDRVGMEAWEVARERVSAELIQSEVRHVLMKAAQRYEDVNSSEHTSGYSFTLFAHQRAQIENWTDSVEEQLLTRMEQFIADLNAAYQTSLNTVNKRQRWQIGANSSNALLLEYADVIAHVAVVDSRIATLQRKQTAPLNVIVDRTALVTSDVISDVAMAEFKSALHMATLRAIDSVADVVDQKRVDNEVVQLVETCSKCRERQMCLNASQDMGLDVYNSDNRWIGTNIYNSYDSLPDLTPTPTTPSSSCPASYHHQIALLRHAFQQTLCTHSTASDSPTPGNPTDCATDSQQQRRQRHLLVESLERLRVVCEQVLVAMERLHRDALQRMRATHKEEVEAVRRDKEQALAEETQATLAALDAMRKAHEAEVVKEVARFKQELSRQQASELLELRERLSVKCLEAAALQEQLGSATRQLAHAHQHILHLEQQRAPPPAPAPAYRSDRTTF